MEAHVKYPFITSGHNRSLEASALSKVSTGVVEATKASPDLVQAWNQWLAQQAAAFDGRTATIEEWQTALSSKANFEPTARRFANTILAVASLRQKVRCNETVSEQDLSEIWSILYDAIVNNTEDGLHFNVSKSAQGFYAVPLCSLLVDGRIEELWRFHCWLPDGERGNADIAVHSHQSYAQSWVLAGAGTDLTIAVEPVSDKAAATHNEYSLTWQADKESGTAYKTHRTSSTIVNTGKSVAASVTRSEFHAQNSTYSIPAGHFHRSLVPGDQIHSTLFVFDSPRGYEQDAGVLGPVDGTSFVQQRQSPGVSSRALAEIAQATRQWQQKHSNATEMEQVPEMARIWKQLSAL